MSDKKPSINERAVLAKTAMEEKDVQRLYALYSQAEEDLKALWRMQEMYLQKSDKPNSQNSDTEAVKAIAMEAINLAKLVIAGAHVQKPEVL